MPLLDRLLKGNYIEVNVFSETGDKSYKLERTIFAPWSREDSTILIDGQRYIIDHSCIVWKDRIVNGLFTAGNVPSINLKRGSMVPLHWEKEGHVEISSLEYQNELAGLAGINLIRNKETQAYRKYITLLALMSLVGVLSVVVIFKLPDIMAAFKSASTPTTSPTTGPRFIYWLWRLIGR